MPPRQPPSPPHVRAPRGLRRNGARAGDLPRLWLLSDPRNLDVFAAALARLARGSGVVWREDHCFPAAFARIARARRLCVVLGVGAGVGPDRIGLAADFGRNGFRGLCGPPAALARRGMVRAGALRLVTAHDLAEIGAARRIGADAIVLSPAFATRSHPGAPPLGPLRWRLLAPRAHAPVIALGGMNARRARRLGALRWAAIDGLSGQDS